MATVNTEDLISTTEAAILIGVSERRVQQYCKNGRLGFKAGRNYLITRRDARKFKANPRGIPLSQK